MTSKLKLFNCSIEDTDKSLIIKKIDRIIRNNPPQLMKNNDDRRALVKKIKVLETNAENLMEAVVPHYSFSKQIVGDSVKDFSNVLFIFPFAVTMVFRAGKPPGKGFLNRIDQANNIGGSENFEEVFSKLSIESPSKDMFELLDDSKKKKYSTSNKTSEEIENFLINLPSACSFLRSGIYDDNDTSDFSGWSMMDCIREMIPDVWPVYINVPVSFSSHHSDWKDVKSPWFSHYNWVPFFDFNEFFVREKDVIDSVEGFRFVWTSFFCIQEFCRGLSRASNETVSQLKQLFTFMKADGMIHLCLEKLKNQTNVYKCSLPQHNQLRLGLNSENPFYSIVNQYKHLLDVVHGVELREEFEYIHVKNQYCDLLDEFSEVFDGICVKQNFNNENFNGDFDKLKNAIIFLGRYIHRRKLMKEMPVTII